MHKGSSLDILKPFFRFPFDQEGWQRQFLIGSGLVFLGMFIPVVPLVFVAGYAAQVMRASLSGREPSMPEWSDFGRLGRDGLTVMGISAVYLLPGLILYFGGIAVYMVFSFVSPFAMMPFGDSAPVAVAFVLVFLGGLALFFFALAAGSVLTIAGMIPTPLATAHALAESRFGAAFRFGEMRRLLRANRLGYLVAWIAMAGLSAIVYLGLMVGYYTVVLCAVIPFITAPLLFYLYLVGAAIFGQAYRDCRAAAGEL